MIDGAHGDNNTGDGDEDHGDGDDFDDDVSEVIGNNTILDNRFL